MKLHHQNIVEFKGYFLRLNKLYMVLEYIQGGSLWELLNQRRLSLDETFLYLSQIVAALHYLHSLKIIHRDIKSENILLLSSNQLKICDFGFCAPFGDDQKRISQCGTQEYMCPEILNKQQQNDKVDVWCVGILLYEMIHNQSPFKGKSLREQQNIQELEIYQVNPKTPALFKKIIKSCLKWNPLQRPTMRQLKVLLETSSREFIDQQSSLGN